MTNFAPKLEDSKDGQLWQLINQSSPHYGSLASDELTRRTLIKLEETIKTFNEQSSKQTDKLVGLTWWIVGLTVAMLIGLIIQIILAL
ncbi:MAG: hypothetical protein UV64_C0004G0021 [Parcubacteria group bacterium GW2011_GWC1_43_11b]|uniref:Uncharacterized protein n=1 Tax=Candidatus Vogelbacteria bacterium RIFOXYB1_FULL_42_16 TaxID=1802436 RepID=A0A1G2QCK2_9BACT|nr:MAG: hypothetical protein UV50_C0009G0028 [Parcubacteria group bacterium GW2011_GWB1_42_9]KKS89553.1 MAG: hypothetical protein UV64_C0004G0021 [Parcubacteria group bacterium GW2011_GWC1_43_11b]KKT09872.1 MAG: hypothetical protein UV88_C0004G0023 [Parcubacteria group bacterium GW2011_GWA1_43_21]OHA58168.1 MAG: hypothetical protein A2370_00495 [Candidatus Vogelbacteria bacterium RIFOXYB1_FULL_42_16]